MFEQDTITHHIQKYIIGVLIHQKYARFRDLKPPRVDSNLYSYHLKKLLKQKIIQKIDERYTLTLKGLMYIDRVSEKNMSIRSQPKIITMLVIQNSNGDVLLQKRTKQPYIDQWTLPKKKKKIDDAGMGVADDHGAPGTDVVDILVAVDVADGTAFGPGNERRRAADAVIRADRAVDAARHEGLRFFKSSS